MKPYKISIVQQHKEADKNLNTLIIALKLIKYVV